MQYKQSYNNFGKEISVSEKVRTVHVKYYVENSTYKSIHRLTITFMVTVVINVQ